MLRFKSKTTRQPSTKKALVPADDAEDKDATLHKSLHMCIGS